MISTTSLFSQIVGIIEKHEFFRIVRYRKAEYDSKGFSSWDQFVAMLFCQLAAAKSLREISYGLKTSSGKLNHLGLEKAPHRSTLSYANNHRPWEVYKDLFFHLLEKHQNQTFEKKKKFRFKNKLMSLDSTIMDLCLSLFPWADFRQTKGAVKLHVLLDHEGYFPIFADLTNGDVHDINVAKGLKLPRNSIIAMDRGYNSYSLFRKWTKEGVYFVSRMKKNADYQVVGRRKPKWDYIICDQDIEWNGYMSQRNCPITLRRVRIKDPETGKKLVFITNNFSLSADTIAQIYKDRWQIEMFFKELKQHLKIKTFVGTTRNALLTQIWTALIAIMLLKYMRHRSKQGWSLSNLVALLRMNLFTYRALWKWLDQPLNTPPGLPYDPQLSLSLGQHTVK